MADTLFFNVSGVSEWTTRNGVNGRLFGIAPNQIFLPAAGYQDYYGEFVDAAGISGNYWGKAASGRVFESIYGVYLSFDSNAVDVYNNRSSGSRLSVRCVAVE